RFRTSESEYVSSAAPMSRNETSSASPPAPVTRNDMSAERRADGESESKPINRNEMTLVASQKRKRTSRLSASTAPSIAVMELSMRARNGPRAAARRSARYAPAYMTTHAPTPEMSKQNRKANPSSRRANSSPSDGAHAAVSTMTSPRAMAGANLRNP